MASSSRWKLDRTCTAHPRVSVHVDQSTPNKEVGPWGMCAPVIASENSISYALGGDVCVCVYVCVCVCVCVCGGGEIDFHYIYIVTI